MPSSYAGVSPRMWSPQFRKLSLEAKVVRLYIATGVQKTSEGLFHLPIGHVAFDTDLPAEEVLIAMTQLQNAGIIDWDPENEIVLDREAIRLVKYNSPNSNQLKSALKLIGTLPDTRLKSQFIELAAEFSPILYDALTGNLQEVAA